jgi:hypothetical protein
MKRMRMISMLLVVGLIIMLILNLHPYRCEARLGCVSPISPGIAYYDTPSQMIIGEPEKIIAIISMDINKSGKLINVSPIMEANLTGPSDVFSINPVYPIKKNIDFGDTVWIWWVTPKKSGSYELTLRIWTIPYNLSEEQTIPRIIWIRENPWDQINAGVILFAGGFIAILSIITTLFNRRINSWFNEKGGVWQCLKLYKKYLITTTSFIIVLIIFKLFVI